MFDIEINNIARITERVLGHPRHTTDTEGWTEYNCPYCADFDGVDSDGKYNCCVNYREGYFQKTMAAVVSLANIMMKFVI